MPNSKHKADKSSLKSESSAPEQTKAKADKKNTSLRLDKKTLKALKIRAIEEETSIQKLIERLVEDYLAKPKKDPKKD